MAIKASETYCLTVSDNASCFTDKVVKEIMKSHSVVCISLIVYAPMSNGRAENMVGTLKKLIEKLMVVGNGNWESQVSNVRVRVPPPHLIEGVTPLDIFYG